MERKAIGNIRREVRAIEGIRKKKTEFSFVRSGSMYALKVGNEHIPVSDYKMQSSGSGETELCITIAGIPNELEIKASLEE